MYCSADQISATYLSPVLYLMDGELHRNVKAVQNVASKHQRVLRSVDSMNPTLIMKKAKVQHLYKGIRIIQDSCKLTELNVLYNAQIKPTISVH